LKYIIPIFLFAANFIFAQNSESENTPNPAVDFAIGEYNKSIVSESHIYNGKEEVNYNFKMVGHPYIDSPEWKKGSIDYDGSIYTNVFLNFNLITQQIIVLHYDGFLKVQLVKEKIKTFSFANRYFVNQISKKKEDSDFDGFYELLSDGKAKLLVRRVKKIDETYTSSRIEREVSQKSEYFIFHSGKYNEVKSKKSVIKVFADRKAEIQKFLAENKIRFNADRELATIKITEFYNAK
jgi:hypothetical protein